MTPVAALECLEDARLILGGDADAGVGHDERHAFAFAPRRNRDAAAGRGEFQRVGDEAEYHLLQTALVAGTVPIVGGQSNSKRSPRLRACACCKVSTLCSIAWMSTALVSSSI